MDALDHSSSGRSQNDSLMGGSEGSSSDGGAFQVWFAAHVRKELRVKECVQVIAL